MCPSLYGLLTFLYSASIVILVDPVFAATPLKKKVKRSDDHDVPHGALVSVPVVRTYPMHRIRQMQLLRSPESDVYDLMMEQDAAKDLERVLGDCQLVEEEVRRSNSRIYELIDRLKSVGKSVGKDEYRQVLNDAKKSKDKLKHLVSSHPKNNEAALFDRIIVENLPWTLKMFFASRTSFDPTIVKLAPSDINDFSPAISAIDFAVKVGYLEIVKLLLNWRGGPSGNQFVDPTINDNSAFFNAVEYNDRDIVIVLLHWRGGPSGNQFVDPTIKKNYAINFACEEGYFEIVQVLLEWRGGPHRNLYVDPTLHEKSAIVFAVEGNCPDIVELLLKWESPQDSDGIVKTLDPSDDDNYLIIFAAKFNHPDVVSVLLADTRVDPTAQQSQALQRACLWKHANVVDLLLKWESPDNMKVNPEENEFYAFGHVEKNIDAPGEGQKAEQWKDILRRFVSNPNVDRQALRRWAEENKMVNTVQAIKTVETVE